VDPEGSLILPLHHAAWSQISLLHFAAKNQLSPLKNAAGGQVNDFYRNIPAP
jgi:hypothetical protein